MEALYIGAGIGAFLGLGICGSGGGAMAAIGMFVGAFIGLLGGIVWMLAGLSLG